MNKSFVSFREIYLYCSCKIMGYKAMYRREKIKNRQLSHREIFGLGNTVTLYFEYERFVFHPIVTLLLSSSLRVSVGVIFSSIAILAFSTVSPNLLYRYEVAIAL